MRKKALGIWGGIDEEWVIFVSCEVQSVEAASPVFEAWVDEEKDEAPNRSDCPLQRVEVFYSYF